MSTGEGIRFAIILWLLCFIALSNLTTKDDVKDIKQMLKTNQVEVQNVTAK